MDADCLSIGTEAAVTFAASDIGCKTVLVWLDRKSRNVSQVDSCCYAALTGLATFQKILKRSRSDSEGALRALLIQFLNQGEPGRATLNR